MTTYEINLTYWLKTTDIHCLTISVHQECGQDFSGSSSSGFLTRLQMRCHPGRSHSKLTRVIDGGPCPHGLLLAWLVSRLGNSQYGLIEQTSEKVRKGMWDGSQSLSIISGVTVHYFCHILFVKSKSLSPIYAQGERLHGVQITGGRDFGEQS